MDNVLDISSQACGGVQGCISIASRAEEYRGSKWYTIRDHLSEITESNVVILRSGYHLDDSYHLNFEYAVAEQWRSYDLLH